LALGPKLGFRLFYNSKLLRLLVESKNLFKNDFQMQLFLYFNEERFSEFQLRQVNGEYKFFEPFSETELEENSLEILPTFIYNGVELKNIVRIQAVDSGELLEELIYQREYGILHYRNFSNHYEYGQIGLYP